MRLLYVSEADLLSGTMLREVRDIHEISARNNHSAGITGALLYSDRFFLQLLEGERRAVSATFTRILQDPRHGDICLIEAADGVHREFPNWQMQLLTRNTQTDPVLHLYGFGRVFNPIALTASDALGLLRALSRAA